MVKLVFNYGIRYLIQILDYIYIALKYSLCGIMLVSCQSSTADTKGVEISVQDGLNPKSTACPENLDTNKILHLNHHPLNDFTSRQLSLLGNGCVQFVHYQPNSLTMSDISYGKLSSTQMRTHFTKWAEIMKRTNKITERSTGVFEGDIYLAKILSKEPPSSIHFQPMNFVDIQNFRAFIDSMQVLSDGPKLNTIALRCERIETERAKAIQPTIISNINILLQVVGRQAVETCQQYPGLFVLQEGIDLSGHTSALREGIIKSEDGLMQFSIFEYAKNKL